MKYIKIAVVTSIITLLSACGTMDCKPQKPTTGHALPGTNTVVVGISIDKNGMPQESYKDVVAYPGQTVLYAGPDQFSIVFKNKKTPNGKIENKSARGVVMIKIPEDIFEKREFAEEAKKFDYLTFDYGIRTNGKELDPPLIVRRIN
jgi:hypothetical protein